MLHSHLLIGNVHNNQVCGGLRRRRRADARTLRRLPEELKMARKRERLRQYDRNYNAGDEQNCDRRAARF